MFKTPSMKAYFQCQYDFNFETVTVSHCCSQFVTNDMLVLTWGLNQLSCSFNDAVIHFQIVEHNPVVVVSWQWNALAEGKKKKKQTGSTNLNLPSVTFISSIDASAVALSLSATAETSRRENKCHEMWSVRLLLSWLDGEFVWRVCQVSMCVYK